MKKFILIGLAGLGCLGAGGLYLQSRNASHGPRASELVPAETLFFAQIPDLNRTRTRWKLTALRQLWEEPQVQRFMEKPLAAAGLLSGWQSSLERLERIAPAEAFLAVTSIETATPQMVAGFSFAGSHTHVDELLAGPRQALKKAHPAGRSDLVAYAGTDMEVFTDKDFTVASVFRDNWYLVANDLGLLRSTLDRYDRKAGNPGGSLKDAPLFLQATAKVPADGDAVLFAQPGALINRLDSLLTASGNSAEPLAALKNTQALVASTKLEGRGFRDTIFVLRPAAAAEPVMARSSLALSSPATLLYYSTVVPAKIEIPESALAMASLSLPGLGLINKTLAAKGLKAGDLSGAFGPEFSMLADWPQDVVQPTLVLSLELRNAALVRSFADALLGGAAGSWSRKAHGAATVYSAPLDGLGLMRPSLALDEHFMLFALTPEAAGAALDRLKAPDGKLQERIAGASGAVQPPTDSFGYIDLQALVERAYGTLRPLVVMSLAFAPEAGRYVDSGKLPDTETLSKHLGLMLLSQSASQSGILIESTGALTFNQLLLAAVAGGVTAALPELQALQSGGGFDPAKLLPFSPALPKPQAPEAKPQALEVKPQALEIKPQALEVKPQPGSESAPAGGLP